VGPKLKCGDWRFREGKREADPKKGIELRCALKKWANDDDTVNDETRSWCFLSYPRKKGRVEGNWV